MLLILALAACSPRETPPQLAFTPGPAYTLTDRLLVTGAYTVETPPAWRVIAGPAEDPYTFQFIAPDNDALIVLADHEITDAPRPLSAGEHDMTETTAEGRAGDRRIYAVLVASSADSRALMPLLDAVIASLR